MNCEQKQLILNKGHEKFVFRYDAGAEDQLLDALMDQASNKNVDFDWFDAAVLSFKLTRSLVDQAEHLLSEKTSTA